jgi:tRNA U55 pseudouridine synthase TruB
MVVHAVKVDATDATARAITATFAVGKGTYIRALATELGCRIGVPAHLAALRRVRAGRFTIADTLGVGTLVATSAGARPDGKPRHRLAAADGTQDEALRARVEAALVPVERAAPPAWPRLHIGDADAFARLCNGVEQDRALAVPADPQQCPFALVGGPPQTVSWVVARLESGPPARLHTVRVLHPDDPARGSSPGA